MGKETALSRQQFSKGPVAVPAPEVTLLSLPGSVPLHPVATAQALTEEVV
jgi:hypothetical protein